jgi:hypothetical protein
MPWRTRSSPAGRVLDEPRQHKSVSGQVLLAAR